MELSFVTAFLAGLFSFLAPCIVPLYPAYLSLITGISVHDLKATDGAHTHRLTLLISSLSFVVGFSLIFILLGLSVSRLSLFLNVNRFLLQQIGGVLIFIFGLSLTKFVRIPFWSWFERGPRFALPKHVQNLKVLGPFLFGVIFALGWTPCFGPIIGAILSLAATQATAWQGGLLLFIYSIGLGLPFLLFALFLSLFTNLFKKLGKTLETLSSLAGIIIMLLGLLLITGYYNRLNQWLFELFFSHYFPPIA